MLKLFYVLFYVFHVYVSRVPHFHGLVDIILCYVPNFVLHYTLLILYMLL